MAQRTQGGGSMKMQKYPSIRDYLEAEHPKVYDLFENAGVMSKLNPKKGSGVTFLLPDDKLQGKIKAALTGPDPETAGDILCSLVLRGKFSSGADFKKMEVVNGLNKVVTVKSVSGDKVSIDNGELSPDKFRPMERVGNAARDNMAVWLLKGEVNYSSASEAKFRSDKAEPAEPAKIEGGAEDGDVSSLTGVFNGALIGDVKALDRRAQSNFKHIHCAVSRILRVLESDSEFREEYLIAKCILTGLPLADFYLLLRNPLLLDPARIYSAYSRGIDNDRDVTSYNEFMFKAAEGDDIGKALSKEHCREVAAAKERAIDSARGRGRAIVEGILNLYAILDAENRIGNISGVYPEVLARKYKANPNLHLLIDEFSQWMKAEKSNISAGSSGSGTRLSSVALAIRANYDANFTDPSSKVATLVLKEARTQLGAAIEEDVFSHFVRNYAFRMPATTYSGGCILKVLGRLITGGDEDLVDEDDEDALEPNNPTNVDIYGGAFREMNEEYEDRDFELTPSHRAVLAAAHRQGK